MNLSSPATPPHRAIITGHSRGLGAALCTALRQRGFAVLGLARQPGPATDLPAPLTEVSLDLADPQALADWLASPALAGFLAGASTVLLINNAGSVQPVGSAGTLATAAIARAIQLNVTAPLALGDAFVASTTAQQDRRLLHISSGAGRSPLPGWSIYGATKAALDHHARVIAAEALPGLRVASIAPGVIDTAMQAEIRATPLERFALRPRFEQLAHDGQLSSPADCAARLVDYLLAPDFGEPVLADLRQARPATPAGVQGSAA